MRVTSSSFPTLIARQLTELSTKQARLQSQAGTGQRFSVASEDPRSMRTVLDLQGELKTLAQYEKNINKLKENLETQYSVTNFLKKLSDRAGEIGTLSEAIRTPDELKAYANEVNQLIEQAVQLGNTRHQGTYLYGGTKTDAPPFVPKRDASGNITAVDYVGSSKVNEIEIAEGITVIVQSPGVNKAGTGPRGLLGDAATGADFLAHLISLRDNLNSGNSKAISDTITPALLKDEENIIYQFGFIGAAQARLETSSKIGERRASSLEALISKEADVDLAQTLVALNEIQNAYMAALKTGGTILSQSLLDYLQ